MTAMVSRTLLVNPKPEQKDSYIVAHEALDQLIQSLKVGVKVSDAYKAAKKHINDRNTKLQPHANFGFGIGFNFKEEALLISADNHTIIKPGMTFHVRIAFSNVHPDPARQVVAIGDTVLITDDGCTNLTEAVQKKYSEISYTLDESEDEAEAKPEKVNGKPNGSGKTQKPPKKKESSSEEEMSEDEEDAEDSNEILV